MKGLLLSFLLFGLLCVVFSVEYVEMIEFEDKSSTVIAFASYYMTTCLFDSDYNRYNLYSCTDFGIQIQTFCDKGCDTCNHTSSFPYGRNEILEIDCTTTLPKIPSNSLVEVLYNESDCKGSTLTLTYYNPKYCFREAGSWASESYYCNNTAPYINNCDNTSCSEDCEGTPLPDICFAGFQYQCGELN
eukprot:TRINITY_DN6088_c0_g2_i2.p1 TRINITY_DN6088_c0_g2~~TRINITY_DN6088_c0_g2_i2.p1  ORF type:complete len:188 (-),score=13.36 TRINITY_DN6088_c0_g2_i2:120-683(-)